MATPGCKTHKKHFIFPTSLACVLLCQGIPFADSLLTIYEIYNSSYVHK